MPNDTSAQPCGCDPGADWVCISHRNLEHHNQIAKGLGIPVSDFIVKDSGKQKDGPPTDFFTVKDSGKRQEFASGMVRDTSDDKIDYLLTRDGPMFKRWAEHLTKGAKKYSRQNWMLAAGPEECLRFRLSAARHFEQWLAGETDEDHAAACYFNINGCEYTKERA